MIWKLTEQTESKKVYQNTDTGTLCELNLLRIDKMGNRWWGFADLFSIPYQRQAHARTISNLFSLGFTPEDLREWVKKEKELLRSNDREKYEKLYALILEKEAIIENTVDPIKQHLGLCCVYVLKEEESIEHFSMTIVTEKLELWAMDIDTQTFFLNWHTGHITNFMQDLKNIGAIASKVKEEMGL